MNLAQLAVARMQDNGIAHCNLFISPQFQLKNTRSENDSKQKTQTYQI